MNRIAIGIPSRRRLARSPAGRLDSLLRGPWSAQDETILRLAAIALASGASVYLAYEFWRLVLDPSLSGGVDLRSRALETHHWFAGIPIYHRIVTAVYPPATYALLWPFVGWSGFGVSRWLWAVVSAASLAYLAILVVRQTGVSRRLERAVVALVVVAIYPVGQTIGDGQLLVPIMPALLVAMLLLQRREGDLWLDLFTALLLVVGLVKFTAVVPFLILAWCVGWRKRPLALTVLAYGALTLLAAAFQPQSLTTLAHDFLQVSSDQAASHQGSIYYANVQAWLGSLDARSLILPMSAAVLGALGWWAWRHRRVEPWLVLGVAGYVARFWSYHRSYDDILILFPLIALFAVAAGRIGTSGQPGEHRRQVAAAFLLAATLALLLVPGGLFLFPAVLRTPFTWLETVVWLAGLAFLVVQARVARRAQPPASFLRSDASVRYG